MPSVPIDTPSRHRDRVELHRRAAARPDALLHELRQPPLVVVAGHRLDPRRRDPDERLARSSSVKPIALSIARAGAVRPVGQGMGVALRGIGDGGLRLGVVGHRASSSSASGGR